MAEKSKILILGAATSKIGMLIAFASVKAGHPTFALINNGPASHPNKSNWIESFNTVGVSLLHGDVTDHATLVNAIKEVDVVINAASTTLPTKDHLKVVSAIKEAGNIKRYFPSEYCLDVDHHNAIEPAARIFNAIAKIRRAIEAEGIPHTYVCNNAIAGYFVRTLGQPKINDTPPDEVLIMGDGNVKGVFVVEKDTAIYTIKAVDDPKTLNKTLHIRPPTNVLSFNELVSLWENKIGKTIRKTYLSDDRILKFIEGNSRTSMWLAINHSFFVKGDLANFEIDPSSGVEACALYPEVNYTTVDQYLNRFV